MHVWYGQRSRRDTGTCNALRLCWLGLRTRSCEIPNLRGLSILPPALAISPQIDVFYGDSIVRALLSPWAPWVRNNSRGGGRRPDRRTHFPGGRTPAAAHNGHQSGPGLPYAAWECAARSPSRSQRPSPSGRFRRRPRAPRHTSQALDPRQPLSTPDKQNTPQQPPSTASEAPSSPRSGARSPKAISPCSCRYANPAISTGQITLRERSALGTLTCARTQSFITNAVGARATPQYDPSRGTPCLLPGSVHTSIAPNCVPCETLPCRTSGFPRFPSPGDLPLRRWRARTPHLLAPRVRQISWPIMDCEPTSDLPPPAVLQQRLAALAPHRRAVRPRTSPASASSPMIWPR